MSSNLIGEKLQNDAKLNGFSAFTDKSLAPINGRYRSKSLSSDKLNNTNADRTAILEDVDDNQVTDKSETPGCLVLNRVMDQGSPANQNGYKDGKATYGGTESPPKGKRVIFCVHGNPSSGCCAVIETDSDGNQKQTRNGSITEIGYRHCHRSRNEDIDKRARRKLIIASILCVVFMIAEIVGGVLSNSLAIATDAAHLLTDFASFMISLFSLWVASRPATRRMPFGWYRAEVIGALTSVLLIWVVTGILVYMAVQRVIEREFEIDATVMLITSGVGVLVNIIMGLTLHQHGHSHGGGGHGHSHGGNNPVLNNKESDDLESSGSHTHTHQAENINVRAAFIHVLGDFLQSFGVFVAAIVIYFKPEWNLVDPICTFLFSVLVLITTFSIIKDALLVLMEGLPRGIDFQEVANTFLALPGVVRVHNLRMWALSLDKTALAAHLAIRTGVSPQKVLEEATRLIHEKYSFFEMTLQIEEFNEQMEDCSQCKKEIAIIEKRTSETSIFSWVSKNKTSERRSESSSALLSNKTDKRMKDPRDNELKELLKPNDDIRSPSLEPEETGQKPKATTSGVHDKVDVNDEKKPKTSGDGPDEKKARTSGSKQVKINEEPIHIENEPDKADSKDNAEQKTDDSKKPP